MLCRGLTDCWRKGASLDTGSLMQDRVTCLGVGSSMSFLLLEGLEKPCCQMLVGHGSACANANTMSRLNSTTRNICVVGSILLQSLQRGSRADGENSRDSLPCQPRGSFPGFLLACKFTSSTCPWTKAAAENKAFLGCPQCQGAAVRAVPKSLLRNHNKTT